MSATGLSGLARSPGRDREPGDERDVVPFGVVEYVLCTPVREVVQVLHARDLGDLAGRGQLLDRHLGDTDVADLSLLLELGEGAELVLEGDVRIDAVQLDEVDAVDFEGTQAELHLLLEVGRSADRNPRPRTSAGQARLRRDDESRRRTGARPRR